VKDGYMRDVISLLDGSRDREELLRRLNEKGHEPDANRLETVLQSLGTHGILLR
jgi:hypothetical protein